MTLAIVIVIAIAVVLIVALIVGRPFTISYRGMKASIDETARIASEIKQTVGDANGDGDLSNMVARGLDDIAKLAGKVEALDERLDERTQVTRDGRSEPEELGEYTKSRMHDVLNLLTVIKFQVDTMWTAMREHGFELPELPSTIASPENP